MKREIKFRAYTGVKMEYNIMSGFLGSFYVQGMDDKDAASMSPFNTKYYPQTPIMQYTGLKDKNGKEIYEGDIIQNQSVEAKIEFHDGSFMLVMLNKDKNNRKRFTKGASCKSEVIGNIYEHTPKY